MAGFSPELLVPPFDPLLLELLEPQAARPNVSPHNAPVSASPLASTFICPPVDRGRSSVGLRIESVLEPITNEVEGQNGQ